MCRHRLLSWYHSLSSRILTLWKINRPREDSVAVIRFCQPFLLVIFVLLTVWYLVRPSAVAIVSVTWLGGLLIGSYGWSRRMALNLSAHRRLLYTAVQVGDEIEEVVKLTNRSILPVLWAEFNDFSNIPGYNLTSVRAIGSQSELQWRVHAICEQRGNYHFGPWELVTGDPFGIFRVTLTYNQQEDILVYPPLAALPEQILPHGRSQGDDQPLQVPLQSESLSVLNTRPYIPGDPLRRIHWPSSARHNTPFVKVFDPEASSTLWLIPDFDRAVQRGDGIHSTLETSIILLASLADRFLTERLAVGLISYTQTPQVLVPARGRAQFWQILRLLAGIQTSARPFAATLLQARPLVTGRERVVVITSSLESEWALQLAHLGPGRHRSSAEVILLDPDSFDISGNPVSPVHSPAIGKTSAFVEFLASLGIPAHVLSCDDILPVTGSYGEVSRWEFQTLGTGRAFARHVPKMHSGKSHREKGLL